MNKEISIGAWISDHKASTHYLVIDTKQTPDGKTVVIGETHHGRKNTPKTGYDVIVLNTDNTVPISEDWGTKAWSFCTKEQAAAAFAEIGKSTE